MKTEEKEKKKIEPKKKINKREKRNGLEQFEKYKEFKEVFGRVVWIMLFVVFWNMC